MTPEKGDYYPWLMNKTSRKFPLYPRPVRSYKLAELAAATAASPERDFITRVIIWIQKT